MIRERERAGEKKEEEVGERVKICSSGFAYWSKKFFVASHLSLVFVNANIVIRCRDIDIPFKTPMTNNVLSKKRRDKS